MAVRDKARGHAIDSDITAGDFCARDLLIPIRPAFEAQ